MIRIKLGVLINLFKLIKMIAILEKKNRNKQKNITLNNLFSKNIMIYNLISLKNVYCEKMLVKKRTNINCQEMLKQKNYIYNKKKLGTVLNNSIIFSMIHYVSLLGKNLMISWRKSLLVYDGSISQQIISFNRFSTLYVNNILNNVNMYLIMYENKYKIGINCLRLKIIKPYKKLQNNYELLTPFECKTIQGNYLMNMLTQMSLWIYCFSDKRKRIVKFSTSIGKIPVMVKSKKCSLNSSRIIKTIQYGTCPLEKGGYFIINGFEKVLLIQEKLKYSLFRKSNNQSISFYSKIAINNNYSSIKYKLIAINNEIFLISNLFSNKINLAVFLAALGYTKIVNLISILRNKYNNTSAILINYTKKCSKNLNKSSANRILYNNLNEKYKKLIRQPEEFNKLTEMLIFPQISSINRDNSNKIVFVMLFINELCEKKSDYFKKLFRITNLVESRFFMIGLAFLKGELFKIIFNSLLKSYLKYFINSWSKKYILLKTSSSINKLKVYLNNKIITQGFLFSFNTGIFSDKNIGVYVFCNVQNINKLSFLSCISIISKIDSYVEKSLKSLKPRSILDSFTRRICPVETPEGESCGLIKNLSVYSILSFRFVNFRFIKNLYLLGLDSITKISNKIKHIKKGCIVFFDEVLLGYHNSLSWIIYSLRLYNKKREIRREFLEFGNFNFFITRNKVLIVIDEGRILRPIYTKKYIKFEQKHSICLNKTSNNIYFEYLKNGLVELLDIFEENYLKMTNLLFSNYFFAKYVEIDTFSLFGIASGCVPFLNHNQAPRNTYHCSMQKQNIGLLETNFLLTNNYSKDYLWYSQKPLLKTKLSKFLGNDILGGAQNIILAINSYSFFDIEDSLISNEKSINFGIFRSSFYQHLSSNKLIEKINVAKIKYRQLIECSFFYKKKKNLYGSIFFNTIDETTYLETLPAFNVFKNNLQDQLEYHSMKNSISYMVINNSSKISYHSMHKPEIGDKFASRYGQKGILGNIFRDMDFPFSLDGMSPEFIINPHGFPSRMTIGQLHEMFLLKVAISKGSNVDFFISPFANQKKINIIHLINYLERDSISLLGKETFFHGLSSELLLSKIFIGPIFYQKLNHLVSNKIHFRGFGDKSIINRQPIKGRKLNGGLRIGEMEKDCILSYGSSKILTDRVLKNSDLTAFSLSYFLWSNILSANTNEFNKYKINLPYSLLLLYYELISANLLIKFKYN